ncbi:hypothetical protein [Arthrobacter crusticola]|nr:hypothetical protein [Arthrobacter crusticola]
MPPANQCSYIAQWVMVKARWGMTVDSREKAFLVQKADQCPAVSLTIIKY